MKTDKNTITRWGGVRYVANWGDVINILQGWIIPLFKNIELKEGAKILEWGMGSAKWSAAFALLGYEVYGMDFSKDRIEQAKRNFPNIKINYILEDVKQLKETEQYSLVFSEGVLEHFIGDNERHRVLLNLYTSLKSGGYILVIVPYKREEEDELNYTKAKLKRELKAAGFKIQNMFLKSFISSDGKTIRVMIGVIGEK
jgi:2-polyprenyl-3-methyl-5-hydroxy-6-metoxy-1,4-benzoquinol methylase